MKAIETARALLKDLTPLRADCGALCGAVCCRPDADGQGGVRLFPGEEIFYEFCDWAKVEDGILRCEGVCPRENRPLGCRIFPLTPKKTDCGLYKAVIDARSRVMCPLARYGRKGLDSRFVRAVEQAFLAIASEPSGSAFLDQWIAEEAEFRKQMEEGISNPP